jgi:hypothetical protein
VTSLAATHSSSLAESSWHSSSFSPDPIAARLVGGEGTLSASQTPVVSGSPGPAAARTAGLQSRFSELSVSTARSAPTETSSILSSPADFFADPIALDSPFAPIPHSGASLSTGEPQAPRTSAPLASGFDAGSSGSGGSGGGATSSGASSAGMASLDPASGASFGPGLSTAASSGTGAGGANLASPVTAATGSPTNILLVPTPVHRNPSNGQPTNTPNPRSSHGGSGDSDRSSGPLGHTAFPEPIVPNLECDDP